MYGAAIGDMEDIFRAFDKDGGGTIRCAWSSSVRFRAVLEQLGGRSESLQSACYLEPFSAVQNGAEQLGGRSEPLSKLSSRSRSTSEFREGIVRLGFGLSPLQIEEVCRGARARGAMDRFGHLD
jgi:hypothetical protein